MTFSRLWQQHNCHVLHELPRHCSWSPAKYKPSQSLTVVNKAWQFVWSLWKCLPHPLHRVHMLSQAHRRMFSIGGLSLLFYWLCCQIIGSGDESGHAGLQGCSPVTAAQRIPAWCFPGRRHNGGCVPADTQHKRWTVRKNPPDPQSPLWFYSRWALNAIRSIGVFFWQAMWCALTHEVRPPSWQIKPCGQRASGRARPQTKRAGRRPATIVAPVLQSTWIQCSRWVELE